MFAKAVLSARWVCTCGSPFCMSLDIASALDCVVWCASGCTLKKSGCSQQAIALNSSAWNNAVLLFFGFRVAVWIDRNNWGHLYSTVRGAILGHYKIDYVIAHGFGRIVRNRKIQSIIFTILKSMISLIA